MQAVTSSNQHRQQGRDHALDLLKWLAILSMVLDHLRYVGWSLEFLYVPGRLAFPWFCLAIAANVARRPGAEIRLGYLGWMLLFAVLAEVPYRWFVRPDDPLNVMPTLALGLLIANACHSRQLRSGLLAGVALLLGVIFRDQLMFGLPGVLLPTACLLVLHRPLWWAVLPGLLCLAGNEWWVIVPAARQHNLVAAGGVVTCLAAPWLGMSLLRTCGRLNVPPVRRWAYAIYPIHFLLLLGLRAVI
ncbi:TraX family protein [Pseudomonas sp. HR96]|uniref:TraX family protein n=1 Tax=Pseudomonas sp. HR96 TaxID=1027966 RepID=UPI002A75ADD9|nr:TraX family protein [Pseudomonas sp. HR96]WPP00300.1 TraX family protein [Pseudomonas sp. HR96]